MKRQAPVGAGQRMLTLRLGSKRWTKLAGHSCPTVAGAWLMTRAALVHLYSKGTPQRGGLRVDMQQRVEEGVVGVIAGVAGLITGAANNGGFKGLAGRFARNDLLNFGVPMVGEIRFTRLDTGAAIELMHRPQALNRPSGLAELMRRALDPQADVATRRGLAMAWQAWVRTILLDHADILH